MTIQRDLVKKLLLDSKPLSIDEKEQFLRWFELKDTEPDINTTEMINWLTDTINKDTALTTPAIDPAPANAFFWLSIEGDIDQAGAGEYVEIYDMAMVGTDLYVFGTFVRIGGKKILSVAKYDTVTQVWSSLGRTTFITDNGLGGIALDTVNNVLYFSGDRGVFNPTGAPLVKYVIATKTWTDIGTFDATVFKVYYYGGVIYYGGDFVIANGAPGDYIAKYTISSGLHASIGGQLNDTVTALLVVNGVLYVGGRFTNADGIATADKIAAYTINTNTWSSIGGNLTQPVQSINHYDGKLYVNSGGLKIYNIASGTWTNTSTGGTMLTITSDGLAYLGAVSNTGALRQYRISNGEETTVTTELDGSRNFGALLYYGGKLYCGVNDKNSKFMGVFIP